MGYVRVFVICILALSACKKKAPGPVSIAVLNNLEGTVAPCGCTSKPLGGLDRLAGELARQKPHGLLVSGATLYGAANAPPEQEQRKAQSIAAILEKLQPLAVVLGARDTLATKLPVLAPRPNDTRADNLVRTLGGLKVGIVGGGADPVAYSAAAIAVRAQGAQFVIALLPPLDNARGFITQLGRIDVAIGGAPEGSEALPQPKVVGETLWVQAGNKGRYLGLLRLHPQGEPWVFNDEGKVAKHSLSARIERLQQELAMLADGPAKAARTAQLAQLQKDLSAINAAPPKTSYVTWDTLEISTQVAAAPWASAALKDYNLSLCNIVSPAPCADLGQRYAGTAACRACHAGAYAVYEKTKHAQAWATLLRDSKQCDVECVQCHTVGFNQRGGFCRLQDAEPYQNVGCENCHGPATTHAAHPQDKSTWDKEFVRKPTETTCRGCHNAEHSDKFDFTTYAPKILGPGHGR